MALREVILSGVGVRDITPLAEHASLEEVTLRLPSKVTDFSPLARIPSLRQLEVSFGGERFPPAVREQLQRVADHRPDVEISVPPQEPDDRIWVGDIGYRYLGDEIARWSIFQDLTAVLATDTNYAAESRVRRAVAARDVHLSDRLEYDSEADAVGIYARNESDIRAVAEIIVAIVAD